jgi:exodeoxyribonuclease V gamma subunit
MSNSEQPILQPKTVLVESTGMQHWLNLQLAEHAGISMNIEYPMPTRYVWQLCRDILGHDKVPMQSTYKREVMLWRIERLLNSEAFKQQNFEAALVDYWQEENISNAEYKRVNISRLIADTLEQYLMFRPKWLLAWEKGESIVNTPNKHQGGINDTQELSNKDEIKLETSNVTIKHEAWQRWIWRELVKEEPNHPVRLQLLALQELEKNRAVLPSEVYFFAINTMAPQTLSFFNEIAKYTQIHFFHLNPCVDYWGDAVSDRALAKQLQQGKIDAWIEQQAINPLLRNFGQQGKDLFNLLSQSTHYEISAFDTEYQHESTDSNLLHDVQLDILQGQLDESTLGVVANNDKHDQHDQHDHSIVVRSCHSALREVQVLHDYLLEQFSLDDSISPRDVLVMCPAIENYSPYIEAVFGKSITELVNSDKKRIPCTIADRNPLDADPLVAAFMQLLSLPDSRFNVTELLSFLHLPAVMHKYDINDAELDLFAHWVQQSNIHWGLNAAHKSIILGVDTANDVFTWHWGMSRLLEGFSYADDDLLIDDTVLALNEIEGQLAVTFGKLLHVLEKLAGYGDSLKRQRSMDEWKAYLFEMRDSLFEASSVDQYASQTITKTLGQFFEHYKMSFLDDSQTTSERKWSYQTIRQALQNAFTSPDSQNQFMTGQVTFCSMMPMRSIPFKIIAVLGLNDGEFPRQSNYVDMDLVNHLGREVGDRSRRGDDRYLFLEAILSARKALYLSYQGKGIRDNKVREPSLVLSEFLAYMKSHHNFDNVTQQPLHPFSVEGFVGNNDAGINSIERQSEDSASSKGNRADIQRNFDKGWYRLMSSLHPGDLAASESEITSGDKQKETLKISEDAHSNKVEVASQIKMNDMIRFFKKPLQFFANNTQGLWLDDIESSLSDVEPFKEGGLSVYAMKANFLDCLLESEQLALSEAETQDSIEAMKKALILSGQFPDDPNTQVLIDETSESSLLLAKELSNYVSDDVLSGQLVIESSQFQNQNLENTRVDFNIDLSNRGGALDYSLSGNSNRHIIGAWIKHLVVCAQQPMAMDGELDQYEEHAENPESAQSAVSLESKESKENTEALETAERLERPEDTKNEALSSEIVSHTLCMVKDTSKKEVSIKTIQFTPVNAKQAKEYLASLVDIYQRGAQRPLLLSPDLAEKLMATVKLDSDFEPFTADLDTYCEHPEVASRWSSFFESSNFSSQFVVDKYFIHYFPNTVEKDRDTLRDLLAIYQPMKSHLLSSKNKAKKNSKKGANNV